VRTPNFQLQRVSDVRSKVEVLANGSRKHCKAHPVPVNVRETWNGRTRVCVNGRRFEDCHNCDSSDSAEHQIITDFPCPRTAIFPLRIVVNAVGLENFMSHTSGAMGRGYMSFIIASRNSSVRIGFAHFGRSRDTQGCLQGIQFCATNSSSA
jgi:hypothetical protein